VVRPSWNDPVQVKRMLDLGAQSLLIPYVQTPEEAEAAVAAIRYPPAGMRGVAGLTRANRFGLADGYATRAEEELCLLVQAETAASLERLEEIAAVDDVDGVFIGPSDLAASLGHPGQPMHPEVVEAVEDAIRRLVAAGTPAGILTPDEGFARRCLELGALFVAVGTDLGLLLRAGRELRGRFAG
jgi:4-hydroxy-2-oxoheptanedioate aldolase